MLSNDEEFVQVGSRSKINYQHDFFIYRQILNSLEGTSYLRGLYAFYNTRVFAGLPSGMSTATTTSQSEEAQIGSIAETLLAIRLADTDELGKCLVIVCFSSYLLLIIPVSTFAAAGSVSSQPIPAPISRVSAASMTSIIPGEVDPSANYEHRPIPVPSGSNHRLVVPDSDSEPEGPACVLAVPNAEPDPNSDTAPAGRGHNRGRGRGRGGVRARSRVVAADGPPEILPVPPAPKPRANTRRR